MPGVRIAGLGYSTPPRCLSSGEIEARIREAAGRLPVPRARSGRSAASGRQEVGPDEYASTLAARPARLALEDAGVEPPISTCSSSRPRARTRSSRRPPTSSRDELGDRRRLRVRRQERVQQLRRGDPGRGGARRHRCRAARPRGDRRDADARRELRRPRPSRVPLTRSSATRSATPAGPSSSSRPTTSGASSTGTRGRRRALGRVGVPGGGSRHPRGDEFTYAERRWWRGCATSSARSTPTSPPACSRDRHDDPTTSRCSSSTRSRPVRRRDDRPVGFPRRASSGRSRRTGTSPRGHCRWRSGVPGTPAASAVATRPVRRAWRGISVATMALIAVSGVTRRLASTGGGPALVAPAAVPSRGSSR